jgi:hypothetical protein
VIAFVFLCLVLTAYRATRLIVKDDFPPILWVRDRLVGGWRPLTEPEWEQARKTGMDQFKPTQGIDGKENRWITRKPWSPYWLAELLSCPWCASAYVSGALVLVTDLTYGLPVPWLVGPAVWGATALLASREWA